MLFSFTPRVGVWGSWIWNLQNSAQKKPLVHFCPGKTPFCLDYKADFFNGWLFHFIVGWPEQLRRHQHRTQLQQRNKESFTPHRSIPLQQVIIISWYKLSRVLSFAGINFHGKYVVLADVSTPLSHCSRLFILNYVWNERFWTRYNIYNERRQYNLRLTSDRSAKIAWRQISLTPVPGLARHWCDGIPVSTCVLKGFIHCSGICVDILVDAAWLERL